MGDTGDGNCPDESCKIKKKRKSFFAWLGLKKKRNSKKEKQTNKEKQPQERPQKGTSLEPPEEIKEKISIVEGVEVSNPTGRRVAVAEKCVNEREIVREMLHDIVLEENKTDYGF